MNYKKIFARKKSFSEFNLKAKMNGHGHEFGHEFVSESVYEADSDTYTTSDTGMSENLEHGLGHGQTSDTRVRSSLPSVRMKLSSQYNPKNLFRSEICVDNFSPN